MNIDLSPVMNALPTLIAALVTAFLIPWIKTKIGNEKLISLKAWVSVAVSAAEKLFDYSQAGSEKKSYVKQFIKSLGLDVDDEILDSLIESQVYKLTQEGA